MVYRGKKMRKAIITGDDFGLTVAVNEGIEPGTFYPC
jgi:hypothetical protein